MDALCNYAVDGGGFRHTTNGVRDGMATEQGYYALTAYMRFLDKKASLYDMSDVTLKLGSVLLPGADPTDDEQKAEDKAAAKQVENLIDAQKKLVSNYEDLEDAEDDYEEAQIKYVEDLIDSIGTVTLNSKTKINRARTAYNNLDDDLQDEVDNLDVLEVAEAAYKELLANKTATGTTATVNANKKNTTTTAGNKKTMDREAVEKEQTVYATYVKDLMDNISSDSLEGEILDVILAYEELTEEEKAAIMKDGYIDDLKKQLMERIQNDKDTGIGISGCDWNIQLVVEDPTDLAQVQTMQEKLDGRAMLGLWDIYLEDLVSGEKYQPGEPVQVKIPLASIGDYSGYDGIVVVHYRDDGTTEYLNCMLIGSNIVFNAGDFSYYAVVGYNGVSPVEGMMTGTLNGSSNSAASDSGMPWLPWTIAGGCGLALIVALALMMKKNKQAAE